MFSLPVFEKGIMYVSYIGKDTCDNSVILPMKPLAIDTPCNVYSLLLLLKGIPNCNH